MKAIVVNPGQVDSIHMRDVPDPQMRPTQVAVRTLRVGLCATDAEINHGYFGTAPEGEPFLILGHENLGIVEDVGKKVKGFKTGDVVVSTVRRPCGVCPQCRAGELDMCSSGQYTERGIKGRHGFMAEYYVEVPQFLHKMPKKVSGFAVLLEPMSIVEKGIDNVFRIQRRLTWRPDMAMVLGAGPIGLLATAVLRARGFRTVVIGRESSEDIRAQIAQQLGAKYISVASRSLLEVPKETGFPDVVVEATGSAQVVFDAMQILGANAVLCLLSVTGGKTMKPEPIDRLNTRLVLGNQVVFGSVNANARHFALGVKDFVAIDRKWPGALDRLLNDRRPWDDYKTWFEHRGDAIKTTLEIG
jgi:threonine dehydrogenase-like Zn-dependent dehydrogenase